MPQASRILVADIGGTNTRVALTRGGALDPGSVRRFANRDFAGLGAILGRYLAALGHPRCDGACIAAAGLVADGVAQMTNLDWTITPDDLRAATGASRVAIINDLQAQGHALDRLATAVLRPVIVPEAAAEGAGPDAVRLVIGAGTGFNAAVVHPSGGRRLVTASECGHASLPVASREDFDLACHLRERTGFASVEEALAGRGLVTLYNWHAARLGAGALADGAAIMAALAAGAPAAVAAGRHYVRLFGQVAGDHALIHLPRGGLYLIGGMARAFAPHFAAFGFADAFRDKGRFGHFLEAFAVHVVEDDDAALTGCAAHMAAELGR